MPESPHALARTLIQEAGRPGALRCVLREAVQAGVRPWRALQLAVAVLFA